MRIDTARADLPRRLAGGAALGAVAGFLAAHLGFFGIVGLGLTVECVVGLALLGAGAALIRWEPVLVVVDLLMLFLWLFLADTPVMGRAARAWVRDDGPIRTPVDAVVVLSSDVGSDGTLDPEGSERLLTGLELMRAGAAPRLVTSVVERDFGRVAVTSRGAERRLLGLAGVDSARWSTVDSVHSTRDEATRIAALLAPARGKTVALVTSPMHTRRACATFEGVGFEVHCVPSMEGAYVTWHPIASEQRVASFREYLYERLGMVKYRAKGWAAPSVR